MSKWWDDDVEQSKYYFFWKGLGWSGMYYARSRRFDCRHVCIHIKVKVGPVVFFERAWRALRMWRSREGSRSARRDGAMARTGEFIERRIV